jgi:hypothetical protein
MANNTSTIDGADKASYNSSPIDPSADPRADTITLSCSHNGSDHEVADTVPDHCDTDRGAHSSADTSAHSGTDSTAHSSADTGSHSSTDIGADSSTLACPHRGAHHTASHNR